MGTAQKQEDRSCAKASQRWDSENKGFKLTGKGNPQNDVVPTHKLLQRPVSSD